MLCEHRRGVAARVGVRREKGFRVATACFIGLGGGGGVLRLGLVHWL